MSKNAIVIKSLLDYQILDQLNECYIVIVLDY